MQVELSDERGRIFCDPQAWTDMDAWHEQATELRRTEPILRVEGVGLSPLYVLTRHADVFDVSRRSDVFFNTQHSVLMPDGQLEMLQGMGINPKTLIHMDGKEHNDYRHVTNDWFKPAAVRTRQDDIDAIADEYVQKLADLGGECDFAQDIAVPYTLRVIMSIFGVPPSDERLMLELTQGIFGAADPEYLDLGAFSDPFEYLTSTIGRFDDYFAHLTADRQANPTDDLASVIANGQVDGCPLERHASLWYYIIVATAGHDTTSYALSGGVNELIRRPDQVQALREDPSLADNAALESIRWASPVRSFLRYAQRDTEVGGQPIAEGERVLLSYPAANRDESVFERADEFDITRPDAGDLISFGVGVHYCLGSQFARREVRTFLPKLFDAVAEIEPAGDTEYTASTFVSGVKHLPVRYRMK
ncbi:MAG: cytochrome P450 [Microthrixaceae bacterium]